MVKVYSSKGWEGWAHYEAEARVWEVFASQEGDDYIGCADTLEGARMVAYERARDAA